MIIIEKMITIMTTTAKRDQDSGEIVCLSVYRDIVVSIHSGENYENKYLFHIIFLCTRKKHNCSAILKCLEFGWMFSFFLRLLNYVSNWCVCVSVFFPHYFADLLGFENDISKRQTNKRIRQKRKTKKLLIFLCGVESFFELTKPVAFVSF